MKRRTLLATGTAITAAAAGLAWRLRREDEPPPVDDGLWSLRVPQPAGGELALASLRGRPLVLNFWATWCPPCLREFPALDRFHREHAARGWQVLALAVDSAEAVRQFLTKQPVGFTIGIVGLDGIQLTRELGNDSGALPFTVVFGAKGQVLQRKLGETSFEELSSWARQG